MKKNSTDLLPTLMANLARIHSNIIFADTKAGVISLVNTSLLGILFLRIENKIASNIDLIWSYQAIPSILAIALLLVSIYLSVKVIRPRADKLIEKESGVIKPGVIDPVRIKEYSSDVFLKKIKSADYDEILRQIHQLTWDVSNINNEKYRMLIISFKISVTAWAISLIAIILLALWNTPKCLPEL